MFGVSLLWGLPLLKTVGLLSGAVAGYWAVWIVYARTLHPLAKVPGPWLASVSRLWYVVQIWRGDMQVTQRMLHARYGPLIRIAPDELACADPDAIKTIYRYKAALDKTDFYLVWNNAKFSKHRDMFTNTDDHAHGMRRRILNHVYTLGNVLKSEQYIDECSDVFMKRLDEAVDAGKPFNLGRWVQMYAYDVVGELMFGDQFGFLKKAEDHGNWIESLDLLMPFLCMTAVAPSYVRPLVLSTALVVPGSMKALKAIENIEKAARNCVADRLGIQRQHKDHRRTDIIEQLYSIHLEKGDKVDFQRGDIVQEAYVGLFAGSDTTAIAIRAIFYYLMKNPSVYEELQAELDGAAASGTLSSPVKFSETTELPYLCAVIKESFRCHPGVQLSMGRIAPAGGLQVCGTFVPAGYKVGMNAAVVHFNRDVFGPDAEQFRPRRWLENPERAAAMDKCMLHFGAGTRTCIGKNISLAELHKLVPDVLRKFHLEMWDQNSEWKLRNNWFTKQEDVVVRLSRR